MNISLREQSTRFVSANQSALTGGLLFLIAFSVFAMNATFNQSGNHPLPLWSSTQSIVTNSVRVPVRRVETIRISATKIPVPLLRPVTNTRPLTSSPTDQISDFLNTPPADGTKVQSLLVKLGFYSGPVDGMIGSQTRNAIREFERSKFLPENGNPSPALLLLLESTIDANLRNVAIPGTVDNAVSTNNISEVALITRIQVGLINYGINDVKIDGKMGTQTRKAIKVFQKKFKLKMDGLASDGLVSKLESVGALTKG